MKIFHFFPLCAALSVCPALGGDAGLRLRFGLNNREATDWSGTIGVSPGKVTLISGWRFAKGDKVDGIAGWWPKGFVNLALLKGHKFALESSSDHGSAHISYALVYAEASARDAVLKAMKRRHVDAAADKIVAGFRCGEHMRSGEFNASASPGLSIHIEGTAPFKRVVFVKDDVEVSPPGPANAKCDIEWTDPKPEPGGTSYYYVRGEQENGELVWASPMWITHGAAK